MTRGEMRTRLRRRINDARSIRFTDADCDDELNCAARHVARLMRRYQREKNFLRATVDVTTDGTNAVIAAGVTDFDEVYAAHRTDTTEPEEVAWYDEAEQHRHEYGDGYDRHGRLWVGLRPTTGNGFSLVFPVVHPSGVIVTVAYAALLTQIATGSGTDSSSFGLIPDAFHDLVVNYAGMNLLGADDANFAMVAAMYGQQERELVATVGKRLRPLRAYDPDEELVVE